MEWDDDEFDEVSPCPVCAEPVFDDAECCPHCGEFILETTTSFLSGRPFWFRFMWVSFVTFLIYQLIVFWM